MRIVIDARFLGPEGIGLGKYSEKLLKYLQEVDKDNDYFVILRKANFDLFKPKNPKFKKILADARWYSLKEQLLLPRVLKKLKPDLVHFLHYNIPLFWNGEFVVTIYDLTKIEFGKKASAIANPVVYQLKQTFHDLVLRKAVKDSQIIISGSNITKGKLLDYFYIEPDKVITIYAGVDELFSLSSGIDTDRVLEKFKIENPFILYVGNAFPYKNLDLVLESLKYLDKKNKFVFVSSRDSFTSKMIQKAQALKVDSQLITTGFVTNEELAVLYRRAICFVFPSFSEGFGLPGLEAMASGCPVIASDIPVFKEIYQDAASYFDPTNSKELADKLKSIIENQKLREDLIKKGKEQVKKYSWEKTAKQTLKVYNKLL